MVYFFFSFWKKKICKRTWEFFGFLKSILHKEMKSIHKYILESSIYSKKLREGIKSYLLYLLNILHVYRIQFILALFSGIRQNSWENAQKCINDRKGKILF